MEDWEESHIDKNLPVLIKCTKCTIQVKTLLRARGCVSDEEVENLTAVGDNHGAQREAKALYDILKTRRGAYGALMSALEESRQTGALDILKAGRKYRHLEVNEETLVEKFLEIPVELFGSVQSLSQHFPDLQNETVLELLNCEIVKRELAEVIQNNTTLKLTPDLPELNALYIPRAISNRLLLDPEIFKRTCPDIFVFKGVKRGALKDLVSPYVIRMSTTQLSVITCRHIHLDDDEDWDDLLLVTKDPLHLVYKDTDGYILQRSTQVTNILHEHWLDKSRDRDAYLSEDKFVSQFIGEKDGQGALVCDVPGMGKTWLMQSIARRVQLFSDRTTVFFIQLDSFTSYLADQNESESVNTLTRVLQFVYASKLAAGIVSLQAKNNKLNFVFVFDGFDEIPNFHAERITLFLKKLVGINNIRLIISSRPNTRAHLEKTFNLISFDILPFGKDEQINSIVNRWKDTIVEGDDEKLSEFAAQCIDSFRVIGQKDRNDILGVPLQCYLLAVVNETRAGQVSNPNRRKDFIVNNIAKLESICELYTQFFNGLIVKGVGELNTGEACYIRTAVESFHTHKALELLFPEIAPVFSSTFKTEAALEDLAKELGMLCQSGTSKLDFIHRSFAEFLAGKFFAKFWVNLKSHDPSFVQSVGSYFIINVMKPLDEYYIHDYEHGVMYKPSRTMTVMKDVTSFSSVLWFMNSLYRTETKEIGTISIFADTLRNLQRLLPVERRLAASKQKQKDMFTLCKETIQNNSFINIIGCVNHDFSSLLSLLVSLMKDFFKDTERLDLLRVPFLFKNESPDLAFILCYIAAFGCPEKASKVFDLFGKSPQNCLLKFCLNYPDKFWTPLEVAIAQKNLEMVLFFNKKIKKNEERLLQAFLEGEIYTNADMNVIITIMETVFECASKFFSCLPVQKFELLDTYVSVVNLINLAWACKCGLAHVSAEYKKHFLEMILEYGNDEDLIKLLLLLFPNEQNKRLCVPDESMTDFSFNISEYTGKAVLQNVSLDGIKMALPDHLDISLRICNVETLKILIGITPDFSSCNLYGCNYLHEAARGGKVEWVKHLIECGYDINERDKDGDRPLHYVRLDYRGVEMTQILVNNKADVYAVNHYKRNFAHEVCSRIKIYFSEDKLKEVPRWVKYLMEADFREIWKMKDLKGSTPIDVLIEQLDKSHPITQEILTLP